jgi:predicted  nucleic acid-binding Zn-ribbon protein
MSKFYIIFVSFIFITGCANLPSQKEEINKEKIKDIEETLYLSVENLDKRIRKLEERQVEISSIVEKNSKQISDSINALNKYIPELNKYILEKEDFSIESKKVKFEIGTVREEMKMVNNRINELKSKIDEIIVNVEEKNKQIEGNLNDKIQDIYKEISGLKKNYVDIVSLPLTIQKSLGDFQNSFLKTVNDIQNNLISVKDTQIKLANTIDTISNQLLDLKKKTESLEVYVDRQNKTLIDELTRQESEIFGVKRETFYIKGDLKDIFSRISQNISGLNRDIENLKKNYNDLLISMTSSLKVLSNFNEEILNLKNSYNNINQNLDVLTKEMEVLKRENELIKKVMDENNKVILNEILRHEKEILKIKEGIAGETQIVENTGIKKVDSPRVYIVQKGDFLFKIAEMFKVDYKELKRINNLKSDIIYPGQKLIIPVPINKFSNGK